MEVVKQEMTRVNIDILGISKLRWTGMGEFNSDDHYIYYCALVLANTLSTTQEKTLHMDITRWSTPKSDWLCPLQPKIEKLYKVRKKQDQVLTVAQIMNSLLPHSDLN